MAPARTSRLRSGESERPCLLPDPTGQVVKFELLIMMSGMGLSYMAFIMLRYIPFVSILLRFL